MRHVLSKLGPTMELYEPIEENWISTVSKIFRYWNRSLGTYSIWNCINRCCSLIVEWRFEWSEYSQKKSRSGTHPDICIDTPQVPYRVTAILVFTVRILKKDYWRLVNEVLEGCRSHSISILEHLEITNRIERHGK